MWWHTTWMIWLAQAAFIGLVLLIAGCLGVLLCRQPVRRLRLMELTLVACLLAPLLSLCPGVPRWSLGWLRPASEEQAKLSGQKAETAGQALGQFTEAAALPNGVTDGPAAGAELVAMKNEIVLPRQSAAGWRDVASAENEATPARLRAASLLPIIFLPFVLAVAYGTGTALFLLRWLVGLVELMRLRRSAGPAPEFVHALFRELSGPAAERVVLLTSERIELPVTFGWGRPVLVLPAKLCTADDLPVLRCYLAHEWSHIERRDIRTWHLATLAQFLFFYQPLFWWLRRQLRLCQDYLADARAAEHAESAEDYAAYLLALAGRRLRLVATAGLGIGDKRSNLHRRITMLIQNRTPLEGRCPRLWNIGITLAGVGLLAVAVCLRLEAADKPAPATKEAAKVKETPAETKKGESLTYTGKVVDKKSGKPLAGATVAVRRSVYVDPKTGGNRLLQETKHDTDVQGKYTFTIPPEQVAEPRLYIELDVTHPDYAPKTGFGYALGMIRKNEKMGGRPFFENLDLYPGKPVTGRVETPDGYPASGIEVLAYSVPEREFMGSFGRTKTDAEGKFRMVMATPGDAVFWLMPKEYAISTHVVNGKRGDLGIFGLQPGVRLRGKVLDAKGKPVPGVYVEAYRRNRTGDNEFFQRHAVADATSRTAKTNDKGEFLTDPLPPGQYEVKPNDFHHDSEKHSFERQPLPGVYLSENITIEPDGKSDPVDLVAVPTVTIEAQYVDSKGKPRSGHEIMLFGKRGNGYWFGQGHPDANGKIVTEAPLGLENTQLQLITNEHSALRCRLSKDGSLSNLRDIKIGTLKHDLKGIVIIRYEAPIVVLKVTTKDGSQPKKVQLTGHYAQGRGPREQPLNPVDGLPTDLFFEKQEDGRFRSEQLLPDEEVTITAHADGYKPASVKVKLPEKDHKEMDLVLEKK